MASDNHCYDEEGLELDEDKVELLKRVTSPGARHGKRRRVRAAQAGHIVAGSLLQATKSSGTRMYMEPDARTPLGCSRRPHLRRSPR
jgi:hypothetical protein